MAGEEQESSPTSGEPRGSAEHLLLRRLRRSAGRPEESLERHQKRGYGGRLLQIVLRAARIFRNYSGTMQLEHKIFVCRNGNCYFMLFLAGSRTKPACVK